MRFIRSFPVDWFVEDHGSPKGPAGFWQENGILEMVASCVLAGGTSDAALGTAVAGRLGRELTPDDGEVVQCFLDGLHRAVGTPSTG